MIKFAPVSASPDRKKPDYSSSSSSSNDDDESSSSNESGSNSSSNSSDNEPEHNVKVSKKTKRNRVSSESKIDKEEDLAPIYEDFMPSANSNLVKSDVSDASTSAQEDQRGLLEALLKALNENREKTKNGEAAPKEEVADDHDDCDQNSSTSSKGDRQQKSSKGPIGVKKASLKQPSDAVKHKRALAKILKQCDVAVKALGALRDSFDQL